MQNKRSECNVTGVTMKRGDGIFVKMGQDRKRVRPWPQLDERPLVLVNPKDRDITLCKVGQRRCNVGEIQ